MTIRCSLVLATCLSACAATNTSDYGAPLDTAWEEAHNTRRCHHSAPPLRWDDDLSKAAAKAAAQCSPPPTDTMYGMNTLFIPERNGTAESIVGFWYEENTHYNYRTPHSGPGTFHFTQVVWRDTERVGCAWKRCGTARILSLCFYHPRGNIQGEYAWNVASPSPSCPAVDEKHPTGSHSAVGYIILGVAIGVLLCIACIVVTRHHNRSNTALEEDGGGPVRGSRRLTVEMGRRESLRPPATPPAVSAEASSASDMLNLSDPLSHSRASSCAELTSTNMA